MPKNIFFALLLLTVLLAMPQVLAAHWIVGYVEDALDVTSPNGRTINITKISTSDEIFGIIGPLGASGTSNVYMVDCELLASPCIVGDILNITLVDDFTNHNSKKIIQVTVTGAGFDMAENISMTSPLILTGLVVDDSFPSPADELDLTPNSTTDVHCTGVVETYGDIDSILTIESVFYASSSTLGSPDDNNDHYTNNSCFLNKSYGTEKQGEFDCLFEVEYYAFSESWNCSVNVTDNDSVSGISSDLTFVNALLSIGVNSTINFSTVDTTKLSQEREMQIINYGNVKINLSLSGYGNTPGDGNSMICTGNNISIGNTKYNVSASTPGDMDPSSAGAYYTNLTSNPVTEAYGLEARQNDSVNDAINNTYWRVHVPRDVQVSCQGNIVVGATQN